MVTLLFFLKISVHEKAKVKQTTSYYSDFKLGLQYVSKHPFLKQFFFSLPSFFVLMMPAAFLTPLQVTRSFGDDVWRLTAIEIAFSVGMMVGGGVIASWGGFSNKIKTLGFASVIMGVCTFALGIIPNFWVYTSVMAIFGVTMPIFNTPATVLLQEKVEEDYLGRVFGVMGMISTSMMPLGMIIFGPVSDFVPIEWLLLGTGVLTIILAIFLGRNRVLLEAGKPALKETEEVLNIE